MARPVKIQSLENYDDDLIADAKTTAIQLLGNSVPDASMIFYADNLQEIETGLRRLNEYASKCWLVSAITLYTLVYDKELYKSSGLTWEEYLKHSKDRLGMDARDVCEQLSSARFFIKNHNALKRAGWNPIGSGRKLARAELALELSGDLKETIKHIAKDTWTEFNEWYTSFKISSIEMVTPPSKHEIKKSVEYTKGKIKIDGIDAISVSKDLDVSDKAKLESYLKKIAEALKSGYEPAIIPVYDNKEATRLVHLRDKAREER